VPEVMNLCAGTAFGALKNTVFAVMELSTLIELCLSGLVGNNIQSRHVLDVSLLSQKWAKSLEKLHLIMWLANITTASHS